MQLFRLFPTHHATVVYSSTRGETDINKIDQEINDLESKICKEPGTPGARKLRSKMIVRLNELKQLKEKLIVSENDDEDSDSDDELSQADKRSVQLSSLQEFGQTACFKDYKITEKHPDCGFFPILYTGTAFFVPIILREIQVIISQLQHFVPLPEYFYTNGYRPIIKHYVEGIDKSYDNEGIKIFNNPFENLYEEQSFLCSALQLGKLYHELSNQLNEGKISQNKMFKEMKRKAYYLYKINGLYYVYIIKFGTIITEYDKVIATPIYLGYDDRKGITQINVNVNNKRFQTTSHGLVLLNKRTSIIELYYEKFELNKTKGQLKISYPIDSLGYNRSTNNDFQKTKVHYASYYKINVIITMTINTIVRL